VDITLLESGGVDMTKYKCPTPDCRFVADEPGNCCGKELIEITDEEAEKLQAK